eukprot:147795-Prymnesium_polylepis.1
MDTPNLGDSGRHPQCPHCWQGGRWCVAQQEAWSNPDRLGRLSLPNIEPDTFSLVSSFRPPSVACGRL